MFSSLALLLVAQLDPGGMTAPQNAPLDQLIPGVGGGIGGLGLGLSSAFFYLRAQLEGFTTRIAALEAKCAALDKALVEESHKRDLAEVKVQALLSAATSKLDAVSRALGGAA